MKKKLDSLRRIVWPLLYAVIMLPMCFSIYYSVPACDDFAAAYRLNGQGLVEQAIERTTSMWWTWGGRWLTQFFQVIINPLNSHQHLGHKYGIYMIVLFFITSAILIYSIKVFVERLFSHKNTRVVRTVTYLTVALFFTTYYYSECYNWFVGAMVYTVAMPLGLLAIAAMIRYADGIGNKNVNYAIMIIAAIFPATIEWCDPPLGLAYVYFIYYCCIKERIHEPITKKIKNALPLLIYIILGISNVFAPGNFVRREYYQLNNSVFSSFKQYVIDVVIRMQDIIVEHPLVVLILIVLIVIGVISNDAKNKPKRMCDFILFMALVTTGGVFPYIYARGFTTSYLDIRVEYVLDFCIELTMAFVCVKLGQWLRYKFAFNINAKDIFGITAVLVLFAYSSILQNYAYLNITPIAIMRNSALIKESYAFWDDVLKEIENSDEENVVIYRDEEPAWSWYFYATGMVEGELYNVSPEKIYDEEFIMPNVYYGKESIEIKYTHKSNEE